MRQMEPRNRMAEVKIPHGSAHKQARKPPIDGAKRRIATERYLGQRHPPEMRGHQLRGLESHSQLFNNFAKIAGTCARSFETRHFDIQDRVPGGKPLRDVVAAGAIVCQPVIAEKDELHRPAFCLPRFFSDFLTPC